jgi:hypothetical protein
MKYKYKKLGALWRAPAAQTANTMTAILDAIGMATYISLYNPRASLAYAHAPPRENNARAAPASKPGDR